MLVKIILALAIACMFMGGIGAAGGITGLKTAIADKQIVSNSAMLDKAIVNWYTSHDYELPESLSKDMLAIMGLHDIDLSKFTYTKLSDNKFRLVANLSGKKTETSVNSDRDLPLKPVSDVPSSSGSSSTSTPSTPDTGNTGGSGNSGTTTPDSGNTGDSGNSGSSSGGTSGGSSTTTPDTGDNGNSSSGSVNGSNIAPNTFGLSCMEEDGNPAKAEITVDFGEDGAEYIVTLYHVLPGGENDGSPDIVSRSLKLSGKVTFLLYKDGPASLYNETTNEYILGYDGFSHSSYWVEFSKKS